MKKQTISKMLIMCILASSLLTSAVFAEPKNVDNDFISSIKITLDKSNDFFKQKINSFKDMGRHWSDVTVGKLVEFGVISGYQDGKFKPNNTITRAEFSTMIAKIYKLESKENKGFGDTSNHWAKDSISALVENKIIMSDEYGQKYEPNKNITRLEMAKMIVRAMDIDTSSKQGQNTKFADDKDIKEIDKPFIILATENKIIGGYPDNTFKPNQTATRAEASTMLVNMLHVLTGVAQKPVEVPKNTVNKADYLPKVTFEEAGLAGAKAPIQKWMDSPVEKVIKGDVNQFPLEFGNVVITGIEFSNASKIDGGNSNVIVVHGYAIGENDKNGLVKGYSAGELRIGIVGNDGKTSVESSIVLEKQNLDIGYIQKSFPNAFEGYTVPLNRPFSSIYSTDIKQSNINKLIFSDSAYSPTSDVLEINAKQIKKN